MGGLVIGTVSLPRKILGGPRFTGSAMPAKKQVAWTSVSKGYIHAELCDILTLTLYYSDSIFTTRYSNYTYGVFLGGF